MFLLPAKFVFFLYKKLSILYILATIFPVNSISFIHNLIVQTHSDSSKGFRNFISWYLLRVQFEATLFGACEPAYQCLCYVYARLYSEGHLLFSLWGLMWVSFISRNYAGFCVFFSECAKESKCLGTSGSYSGSESRWKLVIVHANMHGALWKDTALIPV